MSGGERPRSVGRRKTDRLAAQAAVEHHERTSLIRLRENFYRDIWLLVLTVVLVIMAVGASNDAGKALTKTQRQQEGRAVAVNVVCGSTSAIIEAGRATITGGGGVSPQLARNLERLGFPPKRVRDVAAKRAARLYAKSIADAVERESGVRGLVRPDGSLDCFRLRRVTNTSAPGVPGP